jgi:hypothetical protein
VPRVCFRIVQNNPPIEWDFLSHEARGHLPLDSDPESLRLLRGCSVYATEAQARRKARGRPFLGTYIAELRLPDEPAIEVERTTSSTGHHTVWADPTELLAAVVRVVRV